MSVGEPRTRRTRSPAGDWFVGYGAQEMGSVRTVRLHVGRKGYALLRLPPMLADPRSFLLDCASPHASCSSQATPELRAASATDAQQTFSDAGASPILFLTKVSSSPAVSRICRRDSISADRRGEEGPPGTWGWEKSRPSPSIAPRGMDGPRG
jgi:hypothetical protein